MALSSKLARTLGALTVAGTLALAGCSSSSAPGGAASSGGSSANGDTLQIGMAQIVSHPSLDAIAQGFKDGMTDAGYVEGTDVVYDEQNPQGDQAALTSIANNFKDGDKDLVVAIATPTAQAMAQAITDRPIVFAGVTDPVAAGLVTSLEAPGGNLTGTSDYPPIDDQIALVREVKPDAKVLGIVYSSAEVNAEAQMKLATEAAQKIGLEVRTATVSNSSEVQQAAQSLEGVDAFYVGNDNTVVSAMEALVQVSETADAPVIAADPDSVERGAVAAYAIDQYEMGRNTAEMAVQVLQGADPASLPVERQTDLQLTLNQGAAERTGVTLSDDLLGRADATY